jgi:hypothetical protein
MMYSLKAKAFNNLGVKDSIDFNLTIDELCHKFNIDKNEFLLELNKVEEENKINTTYKNLQTLCDTKSKEAKKYIVGREVTDEQLARYEEKYQIAKEYKTSGKYKDRLSLEAKLQGLTVDDLADLIIKKGDEYKEALITFNSRIEAFRVKVTNIIEQGDLDKANEIIEKAYNLDANSSDDDVAKLFES